MIISNATMMNWERLHPDTSAKLRKGANKTLSAKRIYPKEYITDAETYPFLERILSVCAEDRISTAATVYSLAVKLLENAGILGADHVQQTMQPYKTPISRRIYDLAVPSGEKDILGIVYQTLLSEGEKNISGSYYTPFHIISRMLKNIDPGKKLFLDPCCGSGAFLQALSPAHPMQLWGCDKDPVAVMIAKVNLLCKYADTVFIPRVFCCDYLSESDPRNGGNELFRKKFDLIATNPPWGAKDRCKKQVLRDSFSRFFAKANTQLADGGKIIFLFPEAILSVKSHVKIREMLLTEVHLNSIQFFEENFTGVMTKYVSVEAEKGNPAQSFLLEYGKTVIRKSTEDVLVQKDKMISFADDEDNKILNAVRAVKKYDLSNSIFALGIVTGNNKERISRVQSCGMEPVYTGRDVGRYVLKKAQNYIFFDRNNFQQTAKDEYYRASEKLVYKFVTGKPVFSYDNSKSLVLNSANILIPLIPGYSIKTVLAFLNSELLCYCYTKSFRDIKVLKNNLCQLPFPEIDPEINESIESIVDHILQGDSSEEALLQKIIFGCYRLNEKQISRIQSCLQCLPVQRKAECKNVSD